MRHEKRNRNRPFFTQAQVREYVLMNFLYMRGNIHKRYTLSAHSNKITIERVFGRGTGRVIIDDTDDNRMLARGVHI